MPLLPLFVDLKGRCCVVVGGGAVAERKVRTLLEAGARVKVISPSLTPSLQRWLQEGLLEYEAHPFREEDVEGAALVVAATEDQGLNRRIAEAARRGGAWANVAAGGGGDAFFGAILRRGDLVVAISTGGACPLLSRSLRETLESQWGPEYALWVALLRRLREHLQRSEAEPARRRRLLEAALRSPALEILRREGEEAAWRHLLNSISSSWE